MIVAAFPAEQIVPRGGGHVLAAVHPVLHVRHMGEDAGFDERADIEAHAVVEVGVPAHGLLLEGLPADEDVVWRLALNDLLELVLEDARGLGAGVVAEARHRPHRG